MKNTVRLLVPLLSSRLERTCAKRRCRSFVGDKLPVTKFPNMCFLSMVFRLQPVERFRNTSCVKWERSWRLPKHSFLFTRKKGVPQRTPFFIFQRSGFSKYSSPFTLISYKVARSVPNLPFGKPFCAIHTR